MQTVLLTTGLCLALAAVAVSQNLVCYYDRAAAARSFLGKFTPKDIDPSLCTHIIFSSASIEKNNMVPAATTDTALYAELNNLKSRNPQLKTLLAVGGQDFDDQKFTSVVASSKNRGKFINSAVTLLQEYGFDGLHLDWFYPGDAKGQPKDPERFTTLCQELRTAFDQQSLILSAGVAAEQAMIDTYDVPEIAAALDFINVLTYDLHIPSETVTAHPSPLRSSNPSDTLTTEYALSYWVSKGAPAAKLNMGIAAYGVVFTLATADSDVGAAASGFDEGGCFTGIFGLWSHYETCLYIRDDERKWIPDESVPYAVTRGRWVGYDNTASLDAKVAHIKANGYGGAFVWALDLDDYTGQFCRAGPNPFIGHLKSIL